MKRRAIIISCANTESGHLPGATADNINMHKFLTSPLGGNWYDHEIVQLSDPTKREVNQAVNRHFSRADYSFVVFSGHGYTNTIENHQYLELLDSNIALKTLRGAAKRHTMIVDACRGYISNVSTLQGFGLGDSTNNYLGSKSTRGLFEHFILNRAPRLTVMYSAQQGQNSIDTPRGGVYISSLIKSALMWAGAPAKDRGISLLGVHYIAKQIIMNEFSWANQSPVIINENIQTHFPFAVKF